MEKSPLAPCLSLCSRGLLHLCGSAEAEDGEQGCSHSLATSPWACGKDLSGVSALSPSPVSSLGLEKPCPGGPSRAQHCCPCIFLVWSTLVMQLG